MSKVTTIHDRYADDLASFALPSIPRTITLLLGDGMNYEDYFLLKASIAIRHPNLNIVLRMATSTQK